MTFQFSTIAFGGLLVASLPPLYLFITSSRLLLQYEDMTKKAAKFSAEAGRQLRKTRTTQSSAVVGSLVSTVSAAYALTLGTETSSESKGGLGVLGSVCLVNLLLCSLAARYVGGFWSGAMKAPLGLGTKEYNDAIRSTQRGLSWLYGLGLGWGGVYVGRGIIGFISRR